MSEQRARLFPVGNKIKERDLDKNPYEIYANLQQNEPISWIRCLNMFYVVCYDDVDEILKNNTDFLVGQNQSLNYDTFGAHMLTVDGVDQQRFKSSLRSPFQPKFIRNHVEKEIRSHVVKLINGFKEEKRTELRSSFASRLTILTMLSLFGLPPSAESDLRQWYDAFERALTNFSWNPDIRKQGKIYAHDMQEYFQKFINHYRQNPDEGNLLSNLIQSSDKKNLTDDEIKRNLSIIFFGGISTVEALILNTVYALSIHPQVLDRVRQDHSLIPQTIEESIRWISPVQSATRHAATDMTYKGIKLEKGEVVNCMLGAANWDPNVFNNPEEFNIDRPNLNRHLGFAIGPHHCLGSHLARTEARIALEEMLQHLSECIMDPDNRTDPEGFEFRQPRSLYLVWQ